MDKWLKKPVAKKRKHGEFSYFSYINYMTIYSHKFLTDCKLSELRIDLINTITNHYIFVYFRFEAAGHRRLLEDSSFIVSLVSSQYLLEGFNERVLKRWDAT